MEDQGINITQMLIMARSRFLATKADPYHLDDFINLTVVTRNQGLIPMPVVQNKNQSLLRIGYSGDSNDDNDDDLKTINAIYMQDYMDGYNLSYTF
jgi:hypothetical protein